MKKVFAIALALSALGMVLSGCNKAADDTTAPATTTGTAPAATAGATTAGTPPATTTTGG